MSANRIIIEGGTLIDPGLGLDGPGTVVVEDGLIRHVVPATEGPVSKESSDEVVDATGCWVTPGLVDLRCALREPGYEHREEIKTGLAAAAAGGITSVCALPNTLPLMDNAAVVSQVLTLASQAKGARLLPIGAATEGLNDTSLAPYGELASEGCIAVTQGEKPVGTARLMRRVLEYASIFDLVVISSAVEPSLRGVCDEGYWSTRLGLASSPAAAEVMAIQRDLALAELTGGRLHLTRVSTAEGLASIARAKERGVNVTCDTTAHHLHLTVAELVSYDTNLNVWPPLRSEEDRDALREGVRSGLIDAVVSDHQPWHLHDKTIEFAEAEVGMVGLETLLSLQLKLMHENLLSKQDVIRSLSRGPQDVLGTNNCLQSDGTADITIIDPKRSWIADDTTLKSKARNSPFVGDVFKGQAVGTMVDGSWVHRIAREAPNE